MTRSIVRLDKYNNEWYTVGSRFKVVLWYFVSIVLFINPFFPFSSIKVRALRLFGSVVGSGVNIKPSVRIKYPWFLTIRNNVWIGENVWIDNLAEVTIGNNVCISQGAMLLCGNHNYKKDTFDLMIGDIHLDDGVWVGARATVCPGVTMHSHSILAVGSVATKDAESYGIYQGNPAIKVRERVIL